jgi:hypothetical protein
MQQDDNLAIGAKAIPLIFDECLKMLASNDRQRACCMGMCHHPI